MNHPTSSAWNQPFESPPARGDPVREIADYVWDIMWEMLDRAPTRRELRLFCESQSYPWNHVARELQRGRLLRLNAAEQTTPSTSRTHEGVLVDETAFAVFVDHLDGLQRECPSIVTQMNTRTLATYKVPRVDQSWFCRTCSAEKADAALKATLAGIADWPTVFYATAPFDRGLMRRVGDRKRKRCATVFWFKRADDTVFFLSDQALDVNGTKPPKVWEPLTPQVAKTFLTDVVLRLPGVVGHWPTPAVRGGRQKKVPENVSLEGMNDALVERVTALVAAEVEQRNWPFRAFEDVVPANLHAAMVTIIEMVRDRVWEETIA